MSSYGESGVLVLDKPEGMSSFALVKRVRGCFSARRGRPKVGHTGTLDPLASGVLPLCVGEATRIAGLLLDQDKAYEGSALLGRATDTLDICGQLLEEREVPDMDRPEAERLMARLTGKLEQVPPQFSALKVDGKRAYEYARQGKKVELKARRITVAHFQLTAWAPPRFRFKIACSKGTYVRSLVRDFGQAVGCGATLESLRRTQSGAFGLEDAFSLAAVEEQESLGQLRLISIDQALAHLPALAVTSQEASRLSHGQPIPAPESKRESTQTPLRLVNNDQIVALAEIRATQLWPTRVFPWA